MMIRVSASSARGCCSRKAMKSSFEMTWTTTGVRATSVAERRATPSSRAASSPTRAPGPRRASTSSWPSAVSLRTFTRPVQMTSTVVPRSPSLNKVAPAA